MGMFSGLLDGVTISATSPDGKIECELEDGRDVVMGFAPGSYRRYTEPELARQLATGRITVTTTGLTAWRVQIRQGTIRAMDEEAFLSDLWTAFLSVMRDHRHGLAELRRDVFDSPPQVARR